MKRLLVMLVATAALALVATSAATAQEPEFTISYTTPVGGATAAEACRNSDNVVLVQLVVDGVVVEEFPLSEPGQLTTGACVSTITQQELTTPAYVANCKVLEPQFAATNPSGRPYPYSFYGNPEFTAKNRAGCVYFLRGFHTGTITPGP
jgi:hypothetical protein